MNHLVARPRALEALAERMLSGGRRPPSLSNVGVMMLLEVHDELPEDEVEPTADLIRDVMMHPPTWTCRSWSTSAGGRTGTPRIERTRVRQPVGGEHL